MRRPGQTGNKNDVSALAVEMVEHPNQTNLSGNREKPLPPNPILDLPNDAYHLLDDDDSLGKSPLAEEDIPFAHLPHDEKHILKSQLDQPTPNVSLFGLYKFASRRDMIIVFISTICATLAGVSQPLFMVIFGSMTSNFSDVANGLMSKEAFERELNRNVIYYVLLGIGEFVTVYISMVGFMHTGEHITQQIRENYLQAILRQNIGYFDKQGTGEITTRITADTNLIQEGLSEKVGLTLTAISTFTTAFIVAYAKYARLAGICTSTVVAIILMMGVGSHFIVKYSKLSLDCYSIGGTIAEEVISSIRNATAFGTQDKLARQYERHLEMAERWGMRLQMAVGVLIAALFSMMFLNYGLGFWMGSQFLVEGKIEIGNVLTILMCILMGSLSLSNIGPNAQAFTNAVAAATKIFGTIERASPINSASNEGITLPEIKGDISFDNVKHVYPSRPDVTVLKKMSLRCRSGTVTALVGPSGSGKSTAVGLIERFYLPVSGTVSLDGHDLRTLNLKWLRQQISLVSQEPILFGTSIRENIRYGLVGTEHEHKDEWKIQELIEDAACMANAHDFIIALPDGYDTNVGQSGFLLSGGQKQRIAIARAVVSDPKILLLDEATSALDTKSEGVVQAALDKAAEGRTTIVIAHRLSTIKNADNIVVFARGEIQEQGTHTELLCMKGHYHRLVEAQYIAQSHKDEERNPDMPIRQTTVSKRIKSMWRGSMADPASMFRRGSVAHGMFRRASMAHHGKVMRPHSMFNPAMRGSWNRGSMMRPPTPSSNNNSRATMLLRPEDFAALGIFSQDVSNTMDSIPQVDPTEYLRRSFMRLEPEDDRGSVSSFILAEEEPEKPEKYSLSSLVKFILGFNAKQWKILGVGFLFSILAGCGQPTQAFLYSRAIASMSLPSSEYTKLRSEVNFWSGIFLLTGIIQFFTAATMGIAFAYCSERLIRNARSKAFRAILRQDINFFDREENSVGALTSFLSTQTKALAGISGQTLGTIMSCITTLVASLTIALAFGWKLSLVVMCGVPILLGCGFYRYEMLARFQSRSKDAYQESAAYACEATSAIRTVAALTREADVAERFHQQLEAQTYRSLIAVAKSSTMYAASMAMVFFCVALGFWWGGTLVANGEMNTLRFFICFTEVLFGAQSAGTVFSFSGDMGKAKNAAIQTRTLLEREPPIDTWSERGERVWKMEGEVEFRDVHFRYPTRPQQPVLRGLDLTIKPGQYVALVGPSGCGKSTTISLLERFYDCLDGGVFVDGRNIVDLNINSYREHIALVSQEPTLYQGTIKDNLLLGVESREITDAEIEKACQDANIYDFIISLPDGFNTVVGTKGGMLSGGQKQRVAIARALLRRPKILLLDEATSALDSESEKIVQTALDSAAKGRTTIAVAHRLSTIQKADLIYVFEAGRIVEAGNHTELMRRRGRYFELVSLQSLDAIA
ncbi:ABC multidrug transporter mdr1 [Penicillium angulare]|uniref:ABC multidrug transporter mdr1 n=1 Tax=Penicillium angulare TaxID=116970 RepID=A0A9W9EFU6_9EURO|nr:ABC multidrug transporter mdr1 [Penicillium angulare]